MKSVVGPLVAAVVLALAGGAFWIAGQTESRLTDVHKQLATLRYGVSVTDPCIDWRTTEEVIRRAQAQLAGMGRVRTRDHSG